MVKSTHKIILLFIAVFVISGAAYEEILHDKQQQLEYIDKVIQNSRGSIIKISSRTALINQQIDSVETAISALNSFLKNYENESYMTPEQIAIETNMIIYLTEEVERIQESFKKKVINLYKHGKNYELELLLSSKTPNEYLRRNQYLQKFSQNRKIELRELKAKKFILEEKKKMLTLSTSSQRFYVESKRNEKRNLDSRLIELKKLKSDAESESSQMASMITRYEMQQNNVNNFINNFQDYKENFNGSKYNRINYTMTDLNQLKGNLNLPVDIALISTDWGNISDNKTLALSINNGIDLSIAYGSKVYAVAGGIVSLTGETPFYGKVIIIKHENGFRSVYGSLSDINVNTGDIIKVNQVIGKTGVTLDGQSMHFELWQGAISLNPNEWLRFK
ncbi:MAG: peptidoglycan DD-metalloendopeptidase family protein [Ignavibacteria bacterium]|nr:peptidoglycan DD-metalloendopeptidase family protein [Ignavibacteria bacterium]